MNTLPNNDDSDRTLDALLSRASVAVPADFTRSTLARIRREAVETEASPEDARLDALLAEQPIAPTAQFTQETVRLALAQAWKRVFYVRFPVWASSLAAALAIGLFFALGGHKSAEGTAAPASAAPMEMSVYEFAEMAQLANPVAQAESFLDDSNLQAISLVSALSL